MRAVAVISLLSFALGCRETRTKAIEDSLIALLPTHKAWLVTRTRDKMSDQTQTMISREAAPGSDSTLLAVICADPKPAIAIIPHGHAVRVTNGAHSMVSTRIDSGKVMASAYWTTSDDGMMTSLISTGPTFIKSLLSADSLRVEYPTYDKPTRFARFGVDGLREKLREAGRSCASLL